jgi:hypothetical protein
MDIDKTVTTRILKQLQDGVVPWPKTWSAGLPKSMTTGKEFRGVPTAKPNGCKMSELKRTQKKVVEVCFDMCVASLREDQGRGAGLAHHRSPALN